ncbi:hypothetical protein ACLOJK_024857 [Asimina triloba]
MAGEEEAAKPLLVKKHVYYDNCPGCKQDKINELRTGTPYKELFYIGLVVLCNDPAGQHPKLLDGLSSLLVPEQTPAADGAPNDRDSDADTTNPTKRSLSSSGFLQGIRENCSENWVAGLMVRLIQRLLLCYSLCWVIYLIRDFHIAKTDQDIGYYAGYVGAAYMIGRALTSVLWGIVSDRHGRKPAYAAEVCRPEYQSLALTLISTSWGIGLIVGPAIGGFLAQETLHTHDDEVKSRSNSFESLEASSHGLDLAEKPGENKGKDSPSNGSLLKNWPLLSSIIAYCIFSLHDMAYTEIFSLWAISDRKYGGLSFSSNDVGEVLAISGFVLLSFQTFFYPYVERMFGPIMVARVSGAQHQRGAANGLSMTAMSVFKAIGPAGGGSLFAWAQKRQDAAFLPGDQMVFFALNLVELIGVILTFKPFLTAPHDH